MPKARDENVRNEIDFLNRNDIQPMGNEAANIQLKENYRKILTADKMLNTRSPAEIRVCLYV